MDVKYLLESLVLMLKEKRKKYKRLAKGNQAHSYQEGYYDGRCAELEKTIKVIENYVKDFC